MEELEVKWKALQGKEPVVVRYDPSRGKPLFGIWTPINLVVGSQIKKEHILPVSETKIVNRGVIEKPYMRVSRARAEWWNNTACNNSKFKKG